MVSGNSARTSVVISAVAVIVFGLAAGGRAEARQVGSASIVGQVTDESKSVLPGVVVRATSPALLVPSVEAVTDANGEYRLTRLPLGVYTVEYSLPGFQTVRRGETRLTTGFTAKLDISLKVGGLEETVTVSGASPVVDVASTAITTHVTKEQLEMIPTGRNAYIGLIDLAPGARSNIDIGGSAISSTPSFRNFGMTEQAWPAVDNVVTKTNNVSDSGNFPDFNTAEEATIETMGHDASFPNRGVSVNLIVKSGGNQFHGGVSFTGTDRSLESATTAGGALDYRGDLSGDIGGPIKRDKAWFYLGLRKQHQERDVLSCLKADGSPCVTMNNSKFYTPKVTYQLNRTNKLVGFLWLNYRHDVAIAAPTQWTARRNWGGEPGATKGEWQHLRGNNFVMEVLGGAWWTRSWTRCVDETCDLVSMMDRGTRAVSGLSNRAGEEALEMRRQVKVNTTWFKPSGFGGNHELKTGVEYYNDPYRRRQLDRGAAKNYQLQFLNGTADRISILNVPLEDPDNLGNYIGLYVADTWTIGRRLTLNLGLRYAHDAWREAAGCKAASPPPAHLAFPDTCWEQTTMPVYQTVVPRLRAAYDLTGEGRTILKGGWGRYAKLRMFDDLQPMANNVISTAVYRWRDLNGNRDYDTGETNLDPNCCDFLSLNLTGTFSSAGRGIPNPDEKAPYTDEYSVQLEHQLTQSLAVRVLGIHARVNNVIRLENIHRPYSAYNIPITSADPGPDGRLGTADDTGNTITWYDYPQTLAGAAFQEGTYVNDPAANERYNSTEIAITKRLSDQWQFQGSYSLTRVNLPLVPYADTLSTLDPNAEIFSENKNWEWLVRLSGSYQFPYGLVASARYEQRSGDPYARQAILTGGTQIPNITVNVEPIGTQRLPNINLLTIRGEKRFRLAGSQEIRVQVDVANLTNTDVATAVTPVSGANYNLVSARVLPRIVVFNAQYRF